jgi:hypothetical protein
MISDETFTNAIHAQLDGCDQPGKIEDKLREMAQRLSVSVPTVARWYGGHNLPMQATRAAVIRVLS